MLKAKDPGRYQASADYIRQHLPASVDLAVVLGTGLGGLLDVLEEKVEIPYRDIPQFLQATAPGHQGKFIYGKLGGRSLLCMSGRFHYYEGYDFDELVTPVYVLKLLGIETLILTNAAGAINYHLHPGDICLISDHINLVGASPTRGRNLEDFGPRFYPIDNLYDRELRRLAHRTANELGLELKDGVYYYAVGPHFETPAEIRAMRTLGADLVGMSTVTESLTAGHCGIRVLAFSLATNYSSDRVENMDGSEVEAVAEAASERLLRLIRGVVAKI